MKQNIICIVLYLYHFAEQNVSHLHVNVADVEIRMQNVLSKSFLPV